MLGHREETLAVEPLSRVMEELLGHDLLGALDARAELRQRGGLRLDERRQVLLLCPCYILLEMVSVAFSRVVTSCARSAWRSSKSEASARTPP